MAVASHWCVYAINCISLRGEQESTQKSPVEVSDWLTMMFCCVNRISVCQIFTSNLPVPIFAAVFPICVKQVISEVFGPNKNVSIQLPKELDVKSNSTIVFCMLTWSNQNWVRSCSFMHTAHTFEIVFIFSHHRSLRLQSEEEDVDKYCFLKRNDEPWHAKHTSCSSTGHKGEWIIWRHNDWPKRERKEYFQPTGTHQLHNQFVQWDQCNYDFTKYNKLLGTVLLHF